MRLYFGFRGDFLTESSLQYVLPKGHIVLVSYVFGLPESIEMQFSRLKTYSYIKKNRPTQLEKWLTPFFIIVARIVIYF